jgi:hypothetical protein
VRVARAGFDAELVAFGIAHDGDVIEAFHHGGAEGAEAVDLVAHGGEGAEVEVRRLGAALGPRPPRNQMLGPPQDGAST